MSGLFDAGELGSVVGWQRKQCRDGSIQRNGGLMTQDELLSLVHAQSGHFVHESGYHSNVWWDLEALCHRPTALSPFVGALATRVAQYNPEVICGALVEGAFLALLVAS